MNASDTASSVQAKRQSAPILVGTASWTDNARNYAIINGINLQMLLGQQPGQGEPLPPAIQQALAEQEQGPVSTEDQAETHQETQA